MITHARLGPAHGFRIDRAVFFPLAFVEDIVKLDLNPGECIANYSSLDKGLTPMACRPRDATAIEILKAREQAAEASVGNRTFDVIQPPCLKTMTSYAECLWHSQP